MISHRVARWSRIGRLFPPKGRQNAGSNILPLYFQCNVRRAHQDAVPDSHLQGNGIEYMETMYEAWRRDPESVHSSWHEYFDATVNSRPSLGTMSQQAGSLIFESSTNLPVPMQVSTAERQLNGSQRNLHLLVRSYQEFGHQKAKINPLDLPNKRFTSHQELNPRLYGFKETDLDRKFPLSPDVLPHFASTNQSMMLRDIINACETVYCGSIGVEYLHVSTREERDWIRERIEVPETYSFSTEEKKRILDRLVWATTFEKFMATKFPNAKRFSLEGVESQVPAVKAVIDASAENGVRNIIFPCCHRGKLNILSNVARKPNELIFSEFSPESTSLHGISGDVKYHLGMNYERETPSGKKVQLSVLPNPSHLESQTTLAQGMARAVQQRNGDDRASTMVFNTHTDASLAGQGVIYETLGLSGLRSYETGGTVHMVVNNQIGFTTDAESARSSPYVTDIAKTVNSPVFHVNADDIEAVVFVSKLAAEYRARFGKDCWVDILCYRSYGHNEMDQPAFTQPLMYEQIASKTPHLELYTDKLVKEGVVTREEVDQMETNVWEKMSESLVNSKNPQALEREYMTSPWYNMKTPAEITREVFPPKSTAITPSVVSAMANKLGVPEERFTVHRSLKRTLEKRQQSLIQGKDIDWATAEALAMGSLCLEGYHVRVSGQDVERGTFSQRHAVFYDQKTGSRYTPLDSLSPDQAQFTIGNSPLSEYGVMGFDYGYSCMHPNALTIWEAQFGDFSNNAQCVIDQFVSSAENKWLLRSGLVLSLPHGFDGQGSEHSSARMERFLQLCSDDARFFPSAEKLERQHQDTNMQVVYMTTPANLFHVLRRQLHREFRKPLILFFSKSLLRHPMATSNIEDFIGESKFKPLIPDPAHSTSDDPSKVKRVIYCTGQVYVVLDKYRETHQITDAAITRIEQLHPFPWEQVRDDLSQYANVEDVVWCQEESLNDGPWSFARTRLETIFDTMEQHKGRRLRFAGREATPSVATGFMKEHRSQEAALLRDAFQQGDGS